LLRQILFSIKRHSYRPVFFIFNGPTPHLNLPNT